MNQIKQIPNQTKTNDDDHIHGSISEIKRKMIFFFRENKTENIPS